MKIAIMGTGGIGAILGAALAKSGQNVTFIARGTHLAAIQNNGLRIEGDNGDTLIRPAQATDNPATVGAVDLVLVCVKQWDVDTAGEFIRPLVGPDTTVIPLQNGIDAAERLAPILGAARVMPGSALVTGAVIAPGVVRQTGTYQRIVFGEVDGQETARGRAIRDTGPAAGIEMVLSPDITLALWEKFCILVPHSSLNALTRLPIGRLRDDPDVMALYHALLDETIAVGRARGVRFPPDQVAKTLAVTRAFPPHHMASMANDVIAGNRIELPWLAGKVVALGRELGIPTPACTFAYQALKPLIAGGPR